jgi:hypothetical protein
MPIVGRTRPNFSIEGRERQTPPLCGLIYIRGFPNMPETYKLKPLVASKGEKRFLLSIREKSAPEPQMATRSSPDLPEILPDPEREVGAPTLMQPPGASCEA